MQWSSAVTCVHHQDEGQLLIVLHMRREANNRLQLPLFAKQLPDVIDLSAPMSSNIVTASGLASRTASISGVCAAPSIGSSMRSRTTCRSSCAQRFGDALQLSRITSNADGKGTSGVSGAVLAGVATVGAAFGAEAVSSVACWGGEAAFIGTGGGGGGGGGIAGPGGAGAFTWPTAVCGRAATSAAASSSHPESDRIIATTAVTA